MFAVGMAAEGVEMGVAISLKKGGVVGCGGLVRVVNATGYDS